VILLVGWLIDRLYKFNLNKQAWWKSYSGIRMHEYKSLQAIIRIDLGNSVFEEDFPCTLPLLLGEIQFLFWCVWV